MGIWALVSLSALLLDDAAQWFVLGAWTATVVALAVFVVVVMSGSAYLLMADQGEQWTREELAPLRRRGWRIIHRVLFRRAEDIDHVAIGPGGVVVVETKWSGNDWASARQRRWIMEAVAQVRENARITRLYLRSDIGDVPIWPVVALWPSDKQLVVENIDGVTVVPGLELAEWIAGRPGNAVSEEQVVVAWTAISDHLENRDAADLKRDGPPPRSVWAYSLDLLQFPIGLLIGLFVGTSLLSWLGWPVFVAPAGLAAAAAAVAMRVPSIHAGASGAFVGSGFVVAVMGVAAVVDLFL